MKDLARIAEQLAYLEIAQNAAWKETQQQNEVIRLVAHNHLESPTNAPTGPAQRQLACISKLEGRVGLFWLRSAAGFW